MISKKAKLLVILDGHGITKKQEYYKKGEIKHNYCFFSALGKGITFEKTNKTLYNIVEKNYTYEFNKELEEYYDCNNSQTELNKHYLQKLNINQLLGASTTEVTFPNDKTLNLRQLIVRAKKEEYGLKEVSAMVQVNDKLTSLLVQYTKHPEPPSYRLVYVKLGQSSPTTDLSSIDKDIIQKFECFGDTLNFSLETTSQEKYDYEIIGLWAACRNYAE